MANQSNQPGVPDYEDSWQWANIDDFTPGIFSPSYFTAGSDPTITSTFRPGAPMGAADESATWGCMGFPNGGLGPLPGIKQSYGVPNLSGGYTTVYITGFFAHAGLQEGDGALFQSSDELIVMQEVIGSDSYEAFLTANYTNPNPVSPGPVFLTTYSVDRSVYSLFGCPYISMTTITDPTMNDGGPQVVIPWLNADRQTYSTLNEGEYVWLWPYAASEAGGPVLFNTLLIPDETQIPGGITFTHQGSIVVNTFTLGQYRSNSYSPDGLLYNEYINFTFPPGGVTYVDTIGESFWPESPYGYGAVGSISAGELFMVKRRGGAIYVTGSLFSPTVTYYPGVESTGNFYGHAANTTAGFIYCAQNNGCWAWNGGNLSQKLSTQLRDDFYVMPNPIPGKVEPDAGLWTNNFGYYVDSYNEMVLVSNNWIYNTFTNSWWRLTNPNQKEYFWYCESGDAGTFYAVPCTYDQTVTTEVIDKYSKTTPQSTYQWRSLPMRLSPDREVDIREVVLRVFPYNGDPSSFTVTIFDEFGNSFTADMTATTGLVGPQMLRANLYLKAQVLTVFVTAASSVAGLPGPVIESISLAYRLREQTGLAGGSVTPPGGYWTLNDPVLGRLDANNVLEPGSVVQNYWTLDDPQKGQLDNDNVLAPANLNPPTATTGAASGISAVTATLNATVNPNGAATTYYFEYGPSTAYGTDTAPTSAGAGTSPVSVTANISGLNPSTLYHFQVVASSAEGSALGGDSTFSTAAGQVWTLNDPVKGQLNAGNVLASGGLSPPSATTQAATAITSSGATLNGTVNPNGFATTYFYEYGPTIAYGSSTSPQSAGSGSSPLSVPVVIAGLAASTLYHFQLVAMSAQGTTGGGDLTFTTASSTTYWTLNDATLGQLNNGNVLHS